MKAAPIRVLPKVNPARFLGGVDAIIADTGDLIAQHGLDVAEVREALLYDMFGGRAKSSAGAAKA